MIFRLMAVVMTLGIALAFAFGARSQAAPEGTILVAVSILPQVEFVKSIGGEHIEILEMVPPNSSPEVYEPTPRQMKQLSGARAYFKIGTRLDSELNLLGKLSSLNPGLKIIDCSNGIQLMEFSDDADSAQVAHNHGGPPQTAGGADPHI